jgi:hypothetical protein
MRPLDALAEDLLRLGIALVIIGIVGAMFRDLASLLAATVAAAVGLGLLGARYWVRSRDRDWQRRS